MNELAIWVGIGVCLTQSAIFSGLNLAVFSLSRLRLEAATVLITIIIGPEGIPWLRERELRQVLEHHAHNAGTEIGRVEAAGAINFLALDDGAVGQEGEPLDPRSVIRLSFREGRPVFPEVGRRVDDPFLQQVAASGRKWVVLVDEDDDPRLVASAPALLRAALFDDGPFTPAPICHHPLVVREAGGPLGQVLSRLTVQPEGNRRIIT